MSEEVTNRKERIMLAWRRVMGRKGDKSPDQQIVFEQFEKFRDEPLDDAAGGHRNTAIILAVGGCEALKSIIKLANQKGPLEGKKEPKIIK